MAYQLLNTRIYYPHSKYAPVATVCLRLALPGDATQLVEPSTLGVTLRGLSESDPGGEISITGEGSGLDAYCELVLALQRHAGHEVAWYRAEAPDADRTSRVFVEYEEHATALYAADMAMDIFNACSGCPEGPSPAAIPGLREQLREYVSFAMARRIDLNTRLLKEAATRQDVPFISMDLPWDVPTWPGAAAPSGIVQYGWGVNQRHCLGSLPLGSLTSRQLGECADRATVLAKLRHADIPVAAQDLEFINRNQPRRAQRSAARIGYPVTARPRTTAFPRHGFLDNGVFGPLENEEQVATAITFLREGAQADVWLESYVPGTHYRCLVVGNEVVSVLRVAPPRVAGDGEHTVAHLAQQQSAAAPDADGHRVWHQLARGDGALRCRLQLQGIDLSSVPAPGQVVVLRGAGTAYNGGSGIEVIDAVAARFRAVALRAAGALGLQKLAGIDLVIADLQGPAEMPNCAVTDVDPVPDLVAHGRVSEANSRNVARKYFSMILPRGASFRIPSVSITGTNGKTTTSRMLAGILKEAGLTVGLSCSDGSYLDNDILVQGDEGGVLGANEVLCNAATEAAVLETARGNMASSGIAFERVDVGACLNIAEDHLGYHDIETLDQMAVHKRQVIERATRAVVLNAEDARCVAMRAHTGARELVLFARDPQNPEVVAHVRGGGCAAVVEDGESGPVIVLKKADAMPRPVIAVADIPATINGTLVHNLYNALAAVGIAHGLGIAVEHMAGGLSKFAMGVHTTPGRFNEISGFPFDVLVDAAHNPAGFRSLSSYLEQREVRGRKILVIGLRKFFSEGTIQRCTAEFAGNFDLYVLRYYRPGDFSEPENARALESLRNGLLSRGVPESNILVEKDVLAAVDLGIECADAGDLLVVQVPASGNDKWQLIDRIKASGRRVAADLVSGRARPLSQSGGDGRDLKLLLCGDVMLGRGIDQVLPKPGDPTLHEAWRDIFDAREFVRLAQQKNGSIGPLRDTTYVWGDALAEAKRFSPDLRLINLETAVTANGSPWPQKLVHFRMNPDNVEALKAAQIDCCALSNNHVLDWGRKGLEETLHTLDRAEIRHAGAGRDREHAEAPVVLPVPGKGRVIVISMATASSGIPLAWAATETRSGVNLVELNDAGIERVRDLAAAVKRPGDILVVSVHWGGNYEPNVPQSQREFARRLIEEAGADIIHGHSAHHVRGIEVHAGKLILYGCGDLVNDYEGIEKKPERRALAPDLGLMYFARISPENGRLVSLQMIPVTVRKLRVVRGSEEDAARLVQILNRECLELGTVVVEKGGTLQLMKLDD